MDPARRRAERGLRSHSARKLNHPDCTARNLCARCSMMKVVQYRFAVFRRVFGRDPYRDEPLFFRPFGSIAVAVDEDRAVVQLSEAASATGVPLGRLLKFLGLRKTGPQLRRGL